MSEKNKLIGALEKFKFIAKKEEQADVEMDVIATLVSTPSAVEIATAPIKMTETVEQNAYQQVASAPLLAVVQESVIEKKLDNLIESYEKNKLLSIDDIYRKFGLETDVKRTVFMADIYMKALPENLPVDIKRDSVHNIMNASEIKIDDLLNDAYKRIDSLNNVLEGVVATTEELRVKQIATVKDLEKRIEELKRTMMDRDKFQDTQNTTIEYEIQRVINIVDFVKPKK